jgi:PHD/YefM family antitoxin component YafN of YafNO toxin-antitoxin module
MTTYTYSEARQNFAAVLDKAKKEGKVLIKKIIAFLRF